MRISDWSSDVCSSDLHNIQIFYARHHLLERGKTVLRLQDNAGGPGVAKPPQALQECTRTAAESRIGSLTDDNRDAQPTRGEQNHHNHIGQKGNRSEEHTSELQSLMRNSYDVFCLKKNR